MPSIAMTTSGDDLLKCADALYQLYCPDRKFSDDLYLHLSHGVVYSDCALLLLALPTNSEDHKLDIPPILQASTPDAWWISLCIGDIGALRGLFEKPDFYLPYVGWSRRNSSPRFYSWTTLWKKLTLTSYSTDQFLVCPRPDASLGVGNPLPLLPRHPLLQPRSRPPK